MNVDLAYSCQWIEIFLHVEDCFNFCIYFFLWNTVHKQPYRVLVISGGTTAPSLSTQTLLAPATLLVCHWFGNIVARDSDLQSSITPW